MMRRLLRLKIQTAVIPAQAGIQPAHALDPRLRADDGSSRSL